MGLEERTGAGLDVDDVVSILKGHVPDSYQVVIFVCFIQQDNEHVIIHKVGYKFVSFPFIWMPQFNPSAPLQSEVHGYQKSPELKDRIHCVAYVIDACKISIMPAKLQEKLEAIRRKANLMG